MREPERGIRLLELEFISSVSDLQVRPSCLCQTVELEVMLIMITSSREINHFTGTQSMQINNALAIATGHRVCKHTRVHIVFAMSQFVQSEGAVQWLILREC